MIECTFIIYAMVSHVIQALIALTSKRNLSKTSNLLLKHLKEPKNGSDNVMDIEDNTSEVDGKITHLCHRHKLRLNVSIINLFSLCGFSVDSHH